MATSDHVLVGHDQAGFNWTCYCDGCYRGASRIQHQGDAEADARIHADTHDINGVPGIPVRVAATAAAPAATHTPTLADIPDGLSDDDQNAVLALMYDVDVIGGWHTAAAALHTDISEITGWAFSGHVPALPLARLNQLAGRGAGWTAHTTTPAAALAAA